jgi:phosphatidylglycerophosphate synthase
MPPFASMLKSKAVEDPINVYVERPLAYVFAWSVFRTPMTPNAVTLLAMLCGITAGIMFFWGIPHAMVAGGILLWVSGILDGADGILARAKNLHSEFGRALDGSADVIVAIFTVFGAFYHIWVTHHNPYHLILMVPALGLTVVHLAVYDFYKESYLRQTRPGQGGEGRDADTIADTAQAARTEGPLIQMAMDYILVPHLRRQKALIKRLNPDAWRVSQRVETDDKTRDIYEKANIWPMRLWALVSLAPHTYLLAICAAFDRLEVYLYIRVFLMNGIFVLAALWQRHATRKTIEQLAEVDGVETAGLRQSCAT